MKRNPEAGRVIFPLPWRDTMKKLFFGAALAACTLGLSGCVTDNKLDNYICTRQVSLTIGANAALAHAPLIKDVAVRQATIDGANTTLALVARCDPATPQAVPNLSTPS